MSATSIPGVKSVLAQPSAATGSNRSNRTLFAGIAFPIFFIASTVVSSVPKESDSNAKWIAAYTGHAHQAQHMVTGILLVLAALSLLVFLTSLWSRIAAANQNENTSLIPLMAAAVSAAGIAAGGVVMATISGTLLVNSKASLPSAELLRFSNDLGFVLVALAGMLAAALSIGCMSVIGRSIGFFSRPMATFGIVVAVALLAALAFVPIAALWIWCVVISVHLIRRPRRQPEAA
jgi:hypothetical protein